jgi:hypothetical protein
MNLWRTLGTEDLSWERLGRFLRQLPADAATWRSVNGTEGTTWTLDRQLAAATIDALRIANWQRGGGKKKDRPKPISRPGVGTDTVTTGDASQVTQAQARRLLDARKPRPPI